MDDPGPGPPKFFGLEPPLIVGAGQRVERRPVYVERDA
jgi:hypothetical protein